MHSISVAQMHCCISAAHTSMSSVAKIVQTIALIRRAWGVSACALVIESQSLLQILRPVISTLQSIQCNSTWIDHLSSAYPPKDTPSITSTLPLKISPQVLTLSPGQSVYRTIVSTETFGCYQKESKLHCLSASCCKALNNFIVFTFHAQMILEITHFYLASEQLPRLSVCSRGISQFKVFEESDMQEIHVKNLLHSYVHTRVLYSFYRAVSCRTTLLEQCSSSSGF